MIRFLTYLNAAGTAGSTLAFLITDDPKLVVSIGSFAFGLVTAWKYNRNFARKETRVHA